MQCLQVCSQIINVLGIQEFSYHIRWFQFAYGLNILFYGAVMVPLGIQMITILTKNVNQSLRVILLILSYSAIM
jgi:hypothetical protein